MECRITQPISESEIQIGGGLTFEQARNYTNLINSGGLPFKLSYKNLSVK
jgi:preprotein translocase subunit SecD